MKITHVSPARPDTAYEIEADRHGNYSIRLDGKVIKRVSSLKSYAGKPRWGSKALELSAIDDARSVIDALGNEADKPPR